MFGPIFQAVFLFLYCATLNRISVSRQAEIRSDSEILRSKEIVITLHYFSNFRKCVGFKKIGDDVTVVLHGLHCDWVSRVAVLLQRIHG